MRRKAMACRKRDAEGGGWMETMTLLLFVAALVAFLFVMRKARCLGWVIGLLCLVGFLWLVGVLR